MGYYSKVALAMRNESAEKLINAYNESECDGGLFTEDCLERVSNDKHTVFFWNEIKWYDTYEDITFIMNYLEKEQENEEAEPFYFFRIGEEMGDIEEYYNIAEAAYCEIRDNVFCPSYEFNFASDFSGLEY